MLAGVLRYREAGRPCAPRRGCFLTSLVILGFEKGQWLTGVLGSARPCSVQTQDTNHHLTQQTPITVKTPYSDLSFTVLKTICSSVQPCTPEDGHNGARNMLSYWFINKS